ncbi:MAG: RNA pseudouridine synthase [Candidatus Campbellbacteria bacterium]|nr:RNA pseudouridine synthase [Candidatus Campbellbacteria bacterium]
MDKSLIPNILLENEHLLAVDKPSGLMVHSDGRTSDPTLVDWIRDKYPKLEEVGELQKVSSGETIKRPGIVHRLDKDTSGVILIAKTQEEFLHLKKQFQEHSIEKEYRAIVAGIVREDIQTISRPIGRSSGDFRKWSAQRGAKGKLRDAETEIEVIDRFADLTYISVFPKTGRTHQIRVHLKSIHRPVLCDPLYSFKDTPCPEELGRMALHARKISFRNLNGDTETVVADMPESFERFLNTLRAE